MRKLSRHAKRIIINISSLILALFTAFSIYLAGFAYTLRGASAGVVTPQILFEALALPALAIASFYVIYRIAGHAITTRFFPGAFDAEALSAEFSRLYISTSSVEELSSEYIGRLVRAFDVERAALIVFKSRTIYSVQTAGYASLPNFLWADMVKLMEAGTVLKEDAEEEIAERLENYGVSLSIPLTADLEWVGLLLLGKPANRETFAPRDLDFLGIESPKLALALEYAKSFEEIKKFSKTLQLEVDIKTRQLQAANVHLKELDVAKDEFLSLASHQLRTPLTTIKGYLSMLLEGDAGRLSGKQGKFAKEAYGSSQQMVALINDLLNVSRMEAGKFFLEISKVNLKDIVEEEVELLRERAKPKGIDVIYNFARNIPELDLDESKTRQVIINFIDNALLYTQKGSITVELTSDARNVTFKVTDTGIGIPEKDKKNLFQKFFRASNARNVRPDGTGLGLYLAKRVIEDQGGRVIIVTSEGKGSTFGFTIPVSGAKIARNELIESIRTTTKNAAK